MRAGRAATNHEEDAEEVRLRKGEGEHREEDEEAAVEDGKSQLHERLLGSLLLEGPHLQRRGKGGERVRVRTEAIGEWERDYKSSSSIIIIIIICTVVQFSCVWMLEL